MSIRKRKWTRPDGTVVEKWQVDYRDGAGKRRAKQFARKKDAESWWADIAKDVKDGTHTPESQSVTVAQAGDMWIAAAEEEGLEPGTIVQYRQHLRLHIAPYLGATKLSQLTAPMVRQFRSDLVRDGRSAAMVRKVMVSLGSIIGEAQDRSLTNRNPVRDLRRNKKRSRATAVESRQGKKLRIGEDVPTPQQVLTMMDKAEPKWRAFIGVAGFMGLRMSEIRGLRWRNLDFERNVAHVVERADRGQNLGSPKSESSQRTVPVPPWVRKALQEWKLGTKFSRPDDFVFGNGAGNVELLRNITTRYIAPIQIACGLAVDTGKVDENGEPVLAPRYHMHALRHHYASWLLTERRHGGRELSIKRVQELLGHSSSQLTLDLYAHMLPAKDDFGDAAEAEAILRG